jgi:hypothetical protein
MFTLFQNQINSNTLKSLLDITGKGNIDDLIDRLDYYGYKFEISL